MSRHPTVDGEDLAYRGQVCHCAGCLGVRVHLGKRRRPSSIIELDFRSGFIVGLKCTTDGESICRRSAVGRLVYPGTDGNCHEPRSGAFRSHRHFAIGRQTHPSKIRKGIFSNLLLAAPAFWHCRRRRPVEEQLPAGRWGCKGRRVHPAQALWRLRGWRSDLGESEKQINPTGLQISSEYRYDLISKVWSMRDQGDGWSWWLFCSEENGGMEKVGRRTEKG